MSRTTLWFGLMVLFLAGALTGVVGTSLYYQYEDEHRWDNGPAGRQERIMKRLTQELSLASSQEAEIEPIVKRAHLEILRVRVQHQPDIDRILGLGMDELKAKLSPEQAQTIKMNAITEWAALPATEMFLRDNRDDSDFSAFMSVWFFEEQKHSLVLMEYLRRYRPDLVPSEAELHEIRIRAAPEQVLSVRHCRGVGIGQRQIEREGAAGALGARHRDPPGVARDQLACDRQAQPGAGRGGVLDGNSVTELVALVAGRRPGVRVVAGRGRGLAGGAIYSSDGTLAVTVVQEGLARIGPG